MNASVAARAHGNVFANTIWTIFELCPNEKCLRPSQQRERARLVWRLCPDLTPGLEGQRLGGADPTQRSKVAISIPSQVVHMLEPRVR